MAWGAIRLDESGRRELVPMRWGLIPAWWVKSLKEIPATFNARAESVADKPMFRDAFKAKRCIIPASGFYEWTGDKGDRQPLPPSDAPPVCSQSLKQNTKNVPDLFYMLQSARRLTKQNRREIAADFEAFQNDVVGPNAKAFKIEALIGIFGNDRVPLEPPFGIRERYRIADYQELLIQGPGFGAVTAYLDETFGASQDRPYDSLSAAFDDLSFRRRIDARIAGVVEDPDNLLHGQGRKLRNDRTSRRARINGARRKYGHIVMIVCDLKPAREKLVLMQCDYKRQRRHRCVIPHE
jgi:SOS response associated peptidase (SRAP)